MERVTTGCARNEEDGSPMESKMDGYGAPGDDLLVSQFSDWKGHHGCLPAGSPRAEMSFEEQMRVEDSVIYTGFDGDNGIPSVNSKHAERSSKAMVPECYVCVGVRNVRASACSCVDRHICDACLVKLVESRGSKACPVCLGGIANVEIDQRTTRSFSRFAIVKMMLFGCGLITGATAVFGLALYKKGSLDLQNALHLGSCVSLAIWGFGLALSVVAAVLRGQVPALREETTSVSVKITS